MKRRTPLIIVLSLLLISLVLIGLNFDRLRGVISGSASGAALEQVFDIPITRDPTDDMKNVALGEAIYYTENDILYARSLDNQPLWEIPLPGEVILYNLSDKLLAAEETVGNLYVFSAQGELLASHLGIGPIDRAELLETGQVVVVMQDSRQLQIFDETLKSMAKIDVPEGVILNANANPEYNRLSALILEDSDGELKTSAILYNLQGEALQVISRDDIAINTYSYRDEILVVVPSGIVVYKEMLTRPVEVIEIDNIKSTHLDGTTLYLETGSLDATQGQGELALTGYSLADRAVEFHNKLTTKYDKIVTQGERILTLDKNSLDVHTLSDGKILSQTYPVSIRKAAILPDGRIGLVFPERITLNQLKH
ncbi:MAG TPA: hypothetical protein GXZ74_07585 [Tissierellia bacterium]|nr:hypothetical protein [Tissierellia bacterium]